jgi:threonyl-tRNA synthetase
VLPVAEAHEAYAHDVIERLRAADLRADFGAADEPLGKRIRKAKLEKVPYVLVVGESDVAAKTVGVNERGAKDPVRDVPLDDFVSRVVDDVANLR